MVIVNMRSSIWPYAYQGCVSALVSALLVFGFILLDGICPSGASAGNDQVVRINKRVLTEDHLVEVMQKILPSASFHGGLSDEKKLKYREEALEVVIEEELMFQHAESLSMKVEKKQVNAERDAVIERVGGKREYYKALKAHGFSDREFKKRLRRNLLIEKFEKQEIQGKAVVSEEEARGYYEENRDMYLRPPARRLSHILISVPPSATGEVFEKRKKRAEEVLGKLRDGADFSQIAWDYSDGPFRVKGGDMGLVHQGRLDAELEKEVMKLEEGKLSGLVQTIYGFHIVRVAKILETEQIPFEKVSKKIREELEEKRKKDIRENLIKTLREKADIEILDK
jgi:peptidyl-prolyl cis-trans isomerase C